MQQDIEKMTYKEASMYLDKSVDVLKNAIKRGVLTPLPRQGLLRYLPTKQVQLFKGKPLALSSLKPDELNTWKETVKMATGSLPQQPRVRSVIPDDEETYTGGRRFWRNFKQGIKDEIEAENPGLGDMLSRPLAV